MAIKHISVLDSRWKRKKKATKHMSRRRKLRSALKTVFNFMKSDSYLFAPFIRHQIRSSSPIACGELSIKPRKEEEKKKMGGDLNEYLKCDAYMYAPLAMGSAHEGTPNPSSESASVCNPVRRVVVEQSERIEHILHSPLSLPKEMCRHTCKDMK